MAAPAQHPAPVRGERSGSAGDALPLPHRVPVLATLAAEFAVFDHWYCSAPGETWPNRNFLHAATSDGETNIAIRPYTDPTIFELLEDHGHDWRIYHDGTAQVMAFPRLWDTAGRHGNWHPTGDFAAHVAGGDLPAYSFIEPRHQPPRAPLNQLQAVGRPLGASDSQHPENNLVDDEAYDIFAPATATDFDRGEQLLASVYQALRTNPELFASTVLLVTYDEHGGFYDHLPAPERVPAPGDPKSLPARLFDALYRESAASFDFTRLGVRVPTVAISPLIPKGTLASEVYEHASVPATLRALFAPEAAPLTRRDAHARTFEHLWQDSPARTDLPDPSAHAYGVADTHQDRPAARTGQTPPRAAAPATAWPPNYYGEFLAQAEAVRQHLNAVGEPEAADLTETTTPDREDALSHAFSQAGKRHRAETASRAPRTR
ncbi:MAG TPA: alkaline phosphatase family protein [Nocardioidaceae bacterium]|nr:alkaline phosphatase family protein [Nocardioidaceae bacterium]